MERQVRYCTTDDGVRIGYWIRGSGSPLVYFSEPVLTASEADYRLPTTSRWYECLEERRTVIRFDPRGTGLSSQSDDFSLEAMCRDLAAVVAHNSLATFDLWGDMDGGIAAAAFAARNPGKVAHLVLWNTFARGADVPQSETLQTLDKLVSLDWPLFARTAATMFGEWDAGEAGEYARYMARACDPATARTLIDATWLYDIDGLLPDISCPTLVLHRREQKYFPPSLGQHVAASIPHAQLVLVDGYGFFPWFEHSDRVLGQFDELREYRRGAPAQRQHRGTGAAMPVRR